MRCTVIRRSSEGGLTLALISLIASLAIPLAASADVSLFWYASRPLSAQVDWSGPKPGDDQEFVRQTYMMAALSDRVRRPTELTSSLSEVGFKKQRYIHVKQSWSLGDVTNVALGPSHGVVGGNAIANYVVDPSALVAESADGRTKVVAVRGTELDWEDPSDVLLDLNSATYRADGVRVHYGFAVHAHLLYSQVREALGDACTTPGKKVWLTGHSLGGASATLLAYWLQKSGCDVDGVITFASPTVGYDDFARDYNGLLGARTHRWVNQRDPIPCLPVGDDWVDVGTTHLIDSSGQLSLNAHVGSSYCRGSEARGARGFFARAYEAGLSMASDVDSVRRAVDAALLTLCPRDTATRVVVGFLTAGASEAVCRTAETVHDLELTIDQLAQVLPILLDGERSFSAHAFLRSYLGPLTAGEVRRAYCDDSIWRSRMSDTADAPACR